MSNQATGLPAARRAHDSGHGTSTSLTTAAVITPTRGGISFDCGNGLHAPVCSGCGCECHR